jgi:hypothetical protein
MALSSESQLDNNSHREQNGENWHNAPIIFVLQKSAEIITQKSYGKVATKKSNAKKYINDKL